MTAGDAWSRLTGSGVELGQIVDRGTAGYEVWSGVISASGRPVRVELQRHAMALRREQEAVSAIQIAGRYGQHEAVLPILAHGVTPENTAYLIRARPEGGSLAGQISSRNRTDPSGRSREAFGWLSAVGAALDHLHRRHLLHRDVHPANVVLHQGRVQLAGGRLLMDGNPDPERPQDVIVEQLTYAAPELLEAALPSRRTDIYALAATAYHWLTGRPVFEPDHGDRSPLVGLLTAITGEPPDPEPLEQAGVSPDGVATLLAALSKEPGDRPATAGWLVAGLLGTPQPTEPAPHEVDPSQALARGTALLAEGAIEDGGQWLQASSRAGLRAGHAAFAGWLTRWADPGAAVDWFRPLAAAGDLGAALHLGQCLQQRVFSAGDAEAAEWLERVAKAGDVEAMIRLGQLHERRRREEYALGWYRRAADAGSDSGMNNLGLLWWRLGQRGEGRRWLTRAEVLGNKAAAENLRRLTG